MTDETTDKDPVTYSEDDLKKIEDDVRKATGEEQSKKVQEALDGAKKEMAKQRELDELKKQQEDMKKALEEKDKAYADNLEKLKAESEDNTKKLIEQLKDERQSVVNNTNPFKEGEKEASDMKQKIRDNPELLKEIDVESAKAFLKEKGFPLNSLPIKY